MSDLRRVEVLDKKGNIVSSYMIDSVSFLDKLKSHGVSGSVGDGQKASFVCKFCHRSDLKNASGLMLHEKACILNPARIYSATAPCPKCKINVAKQGFDSHVDSCTGDPDVIIRRKALRDDLYRRKAEAKVRGEEYKPLAIGRLKRNVEYSILPSGDLVTKVSAGVKPSIYKDQIIKDLTVNTDVSKTFDDMVSIMAEHCAPSMGRKYREFLSWVADSKALWDSV
jgi:hypothetical protein